MRIDCVVVNWNAGAQLGKCVASIAEYGDKLVGQVIVVDNGSVDGSDVSVEDSPFVTLIRAGANLGFGKACNIGAQRAKSECLLFLNPDAALYPETLHRALNYMQNPLHSKVGICGVQLLDESGCIARSCARFPSPWSFMAHAVGLGWFLPRLGHFMAEWDHRQTRQVDHVIGAFFLVRRSVFESLNGFDERFFVYLEDLDFSLRARQSGWRTIYLSDVQAFHAGGGTSNQVKARRLFYSLRSRLQYAFKHFSWLGAVLVLFTTLFIEPVSRSALALLRRSWPGLKETWVAFGLLWRWLPQWVSKGVTR